MKKTLPIKRMTKQINRGASPAYDDDGHTKFINQACIYWAGIKYSAVKNADGKIHMPGSRGHLHKGDILVNSTGTGTLGRAAIFDKDNDEKYFADSHVTIVRPEPSALDSNYARYVIQSDLFQDKIYTFCVSGSTNQIELSRERFRELDLANIKLGDQRKAAVYLDKKTATIDKMIAAKNHTRTHLAELRTAIITKAVLGQGSSNNLQQTNIPWIGEVPAHWTVRKLKDLATISIGWTPSTSNPEYFEGDNIWVTIADMNKKHISESKNRVSDVAIIDAGIKKVPKGSLLYSFKLSVGKVAFAGTDLYTNEAIAAIIPRNLKQIDNKFLYYALSTYLIDSANENIYGAKLLNQSLIKNAYIALPPIDEQKQIATELNRKLTKLDRTMVKTTNSLELLKEYRSSLISNVITGKVAV
ncbi:restriction endonuclease subunit S [Candidatus Saccharibacteria bacterium]|jgi:restriction endonuclease S subunit|nr:restriction endonuclease subunit S [Candidatus Saccharibacteria bacterium]